MDEVGNLEVYRKGDYRSFDWDFVNRKWKHLTMPEVTFEVADEDDYEDSDIDDLLEPFGCQKGDVRRLLDYLDKKYAPKE